MKILFLDIETAPNLVYVWGLYNQNVAPSQVVTGHKLLCFAAKWYGDSKIQFDSMQKSTLKQMLRKIHRLLDEADVVVHYYGTKFDIPMLNSEFIQAGMKPPSPYKQVDLKKVSSQMFRFPSNKLEYVAHAVQIGEKLREGITFDLWIDCMAGDDKAWKRMEAYNRRDTELLEKLYDKYKPWIKNHPNHGAYQNDKLVCPNCGSKHVHKRGTVVAKLHTYTRLQCQDCGTWFRSNQAVNNKKTERYIGV
jgi:predicted RNA-binding Zn-ribbon protein involved in translation (DUF1610 family)